MSPAPAASGLSAPPPFAAAREWLASELAPRAPRDPIAALLLALFTALIDAFSAWHAAIAANAGAPVSAAPALRAASGPETPAPERAGADGPRRTPVLRRRAQAPAAEAAASTATVPRTATAAHGRAPAAPVSLSAGNAPAARIHPGLPRHRGAQNFASGRTTFSLALFVP